MNGRVVNVLNTRQTAYTVPLCVMCLSQSTAVVHTYKNIKTQNPPSRTLPPLARCCCVASWRTASCSAASTASRASRNASRSVRHMARGVVRCSSSTRCWCSAASRCRACTFSRVRLERDMESRYSYEAPRGASSSSSPSWSSAWAALPACVLNDDARHLWVDSVCERRRDHAAIHMTELHT